MRENDQLKATLQVAMSLEGDGIEDACSTGYHGTKGSSAADFLHGDIVAIHGNDFTHPMPFAPPHRHLLNWHES
jgi:hypothetical protein